MGKETRKSRRNNKDKKFWNIGEKKEWSVRNMDKDDNVWGTDKGQDKFEITQHRNAFQRQGKGYGRQTLPK
jgi:hypothetical protein